MNTKKIKSFFTLLLFIAGAVFTSHCINEPEGYEFRMENPEGLDSDTDSIDVYVVYGEGDDTTSALLFNGKKGDDGFEGPYTGIIKDYDGEDFRLRIVQYNDKNEVIKNLEISYNYTGGELEEDKRDTLRDASRDNEVLQSLTILSDSNENIGSLLKYSYGGGSLGKIEIWYGDVSDVSKKEAGATITYQYSENRKSEVNTVTSNGENSDSLFSYKNGKLAKLEIKGRGDDYHFQFTYENEMSSVTARYTEGKLDRLVRHHYNSDGDIATDSIYLVQEKDKTPRGGVDYFYDKGMLASKLKWDIRNQKKQARESIDYKYNGDGKLEKTETHLEGEKRHLLTSKSYRLTELGNPKTAVEVDEEEGVLLKYYIYTYERTEYKKAAAKIGASVVDSFEGLFSRMADWKLDRVEEE